VVDEDDGHGDVETLEGTAEIEAEELRRVAMGDAAKTVDDLVQHGVDSISLQQKLGVLQRIVTAVEKDSQYRQILLLAAFDNKQEALLASDAITERQRYGVPIKPILDRIVAQCSVKADRIDRVLRAMTNYTLNTNYGGKLPHWKKKQEDKSLT